MTKKRSIGATLLAIALCWLAVGAFGNAFMWRALPDSVILQLPAGDVALIRALQSPVLSLFAVAYAVTAIATAVGVWRMRPWMAVAFLAWSAVVLMFGVWLALVVPQSYMPGIRLLSFVLVLLVGGVLVLLHRYVRSLSGEARALAL